MDSAKGFFVIFHIVAFFLCRTAEATIYAYDKTNQTDVFDDQTASFGPGIGDDGIVGILVRAEPYDACSTVSPPPFTPNVQENITILQFALVVRGTCDFGVKVFNAQKAGYRAVIVHNVGSDALVRMGSDQPSITSQIYVPSVFIGESSAIILNSSYLYQDGGRPYIQIYEGQFNPIDYYLIPFIIVIAVCFVSLLCFLLIKCLRDRRRARRGRLSLQRLKKLPVKKFVKGDEYDVCAICLDDYEEGDSLRILPCSHAYHCKCVDPWLTSNRRVCPLCKRRVLSDDESSSSSDDGGEESSDDERTPLAPSSVAASPNAPRYGTGFANRNPFRNRRFRLRRQSSSSDDTTSTDVSDADPVERRSPPRKTNTQADRSDAPQTSGLQLQQTSRTQEPEPEILHAMGITSTDPDVYLDSAEAMMTRTTNRVSESSIAVLSDVETLESTPDPHSYSSQDFHSLDESMTVAQTPFNLDSRRSAMPDSDPDDIVVITNGSTVQTHGDDSEV